MNINQNFVLLAMSKYKEQYDVIYMFERYSEIKNVNNQIAQKILEKVEILIHKYGEVYLKRSNDYPTLLHKYVKNILESKRGKIDYDVCEFIISRYYPDNLNIRDKDGNTVAQLIPRNIWDKKMINLFKQNGAIINIKPDHYQKFVDIPCHFIKDYEERLCSICIERSSKIVTLGCLHCAMCEECSNLVKKCPICRESFNENQKIRIFFS